jgi:hypothetical protein
VQEKSADVMQHQEDQTDCEVAQEEPMQADSEPEEVQEESEEAQEKHAEAQVPQETLAADDNLIAMNIKEVIEAAVDFVSAQEEVGQQSIVVLDQADQGVFV